MKIGTVEIPNCFVLAPLAGISCTAFRMLCKENGAGLVYTQMIDGDIISEKTSKEAKQFLNIQDVERPVTFQLIGSEKNVLVKAIQVVEEFADLFDFNVGCIEEDYLQKGCVAALLKNLPKLADRAQRNLGLATLCQGVDGQRRLVDPDRLRSARQEHVQAQGILGGQEVHGSV